VRATLRAGWIRLGHRAAHALAPVVGRLCLPDMSRLEWLRFVPPLPHPLRRVVAAPVWRQRAPSAPEELSGIPGNPRDPELEDAAFHERPLHVFVRLHPEAFAWNLAHMWHIVIPTWPRLARAQRRAAAVRSRPIPDAARPPAAELTERVQREAARLGLSAIGFAAYDERYTLAEFAGTHARGSVIVCVLEQDYAATQTAPSARAERSAFVAYGELLDRTARLAEFLRGQGVDAHPHNPAGETIAIHYGVAAGLGQMGLNGQLLTPAAGSRARLAIITTDAELVHGEPRDLGIHAICDRCQACVRRCPVGAIPRQRRPYRGVTKAKIKTERCFPVTAQAEGCAVCMKVCPIQRYGLEAVRSHLVVHGEILGRGSDELEGYVWPLDGRHYGPDAKPRIDGATLLTPRGWRFDADRTEPADEQTNPSRASEASEERREHDHATRV
jgi:epoxyqueuosine reductase